MGKGKRCTSCGDKMIPAKETAAANDSTVMAQPQQIKQMQPSTVTNIAISQRGKNIAASKLYLVNYPLGIKMQAIDGAIIGRRQGPYTTILSSQPYISSKHASLKNDPDSGWNIVDLDSSNGTFVNKVKLAPDTPCPLKHGMKVKLANVELLVEFE